MDEYLHFLDGRDILQTGPNMAWPTAKVAWEASTTELVLAQQAFAQEAQVRRALRLLQRCERRNPPPSRSFRRSFKKSLMLRGPTRWITALAEAGHAQRASVAALESEQAMWEAAVANMRMWETLFSESVQEKGLTRESLVSYKL